MNCLVKMLKSSDKMDLDILNSSCVFDQSVIVK